MTSKTPRLDAARGDSALGRVARYAELIRELEHENAELARENAGLRAVIVELRVLLNGGQS